MRELYKNYIAQEREILDYVMLSTANALNDAQYDYDLIIKAKHFYGIYRRLLRYGKIENIHDLIAFKILIDKIEDCYKARNTVNMMYEKVPGKSKDYIISPKTNRYMGLHTSIYAPDGAMIQFQFKTHDMYRINQYGITEYWKHIRSKEESKASIEMQDEVKKMQFYRFLEYIGKEDLSFKEYSDEIRSDILSKMIYVENNRKKVIELPENSTVLDFAFRTNPDKAEYLWGALVNGEKAQFNQKLENSDVVKLVYGEEKLNPEGLDAQCTTHFAKRKIRNMKQ